MKKRSLLALLGAITTTMLAASEARLIYSELWEWDNEATQASRLTGWKKMTGFDQSCATVILDDEGRKVLKLAPVEGATPLLSKDQFTIGDKVKLEMAFTRLTPEGTWFRLSLLSGEVPTAGYWLQLYHNRVELVRSSGGDDSIILDVRKLQGNELPIEKSTLVALETNLAAGKVAVSINGKVLFEIDDKSPFEAGATVRIGLRSQSGVEVLVESIKLLSQDN